MTDPSVANIYRLLGKIEPAQFTIILDEAKDAQGEKHTAKMRTVAAIDATVRIVCKRFHGFSNLSLTCAISLPEALVTSNFASLWFIGTFPSIVRQNEPGVYRTEEVISKANCIEFASL